MSPGIITYYTQTSLLYQIEVLKGANVSISLSAREKKKLPWKANHTVTNTLKRLLFFTSD